MALKASGSAPAHRHCPVCGISIAPTKDYCSTECSEIDETNQRKVKNYRRLTLLLMVAALAVLLAVSFFLRSHA